MINFTISTASNSLLADLVHFYFTYQTSNVTCHHRGPKWMLQAGYRASSLQCMSYLCELLFCKASSIFSSSSVVSRAFSACAHAMHVFHVPASSSPPRLPLCQISFVLRPHTQSLSHSPSLFDMLATEAYRFGKNTF